MCVILSINQIIYNLRKQNGLTLELVGQTVGVSKSTVKKWESGQISNIGHEKLEKLAKLFNVNVSTFFNKENSINQRYHFSHDGFINVGAVSPKIKVADVEYNKEQIINAILKAEKQGVQVLVLPELCLTGYTCADLFLQPFLIEKAKTALIEIARTTKDMLSVVGLPLNVQGKLYNAAAVMQKGKVLCFIPKKNIQDFGEVSEKRYFTTLKQPLEVQIDNYTVPLSNNIIICNNQLKIGVEIGSDLNDVNAPSNSHALAGANVILNLSANAEIVGRADLRRLLVKSQSAKLISAYIYANAGEGESTTDLVFCSHNIIAEKGKILNESKLSNDIVFTQIDVKKLSNERIKNTSFTQDNSNYTYINFELSSKDFKFTRHIERQPFVPSDEKKRNEVCEEILNLQALGLKKRLEHTRAKKCVIGISGGLDSTLAALVTIRALDMLQLPHDSLIAVTMPCFGTTKRTKSNAQMLCQQLGTDFKSVDITKSVKCHFEDIGQDENNFDVTFENAQARERTQVLMDIANMQGGLVIGTGDLSELALGWATYNGDHMSMYAVNSSVPKTLIRHLVKYVATTTKDKKLSKILLDILDTPVSPELLPAKDGEISQITENLVGPYDLHDFFLYNFAKNNFEPDKIFRLAKIAWGNEYDDQTIMYWLKTFIRRFFSQQFKRSCMPDGPKVGSLTLSSRGDFRMPSDAVCDIFLKKLEKISINL